MNNQELPFSITSVSDEAIIKELREFLADSEKYINEKFDLRFCETGICFNCQADCIMQSIVKGLTVENKCLITRCEVCMKTFVD